MCIRSSTLALDRQDLLNHVHRAAPNMANSFLREAFKDEMDEDEAAVGPAAVASSNPSSSSKTGGALSKTI